MLKQAKMFFAAALAMVASALLAGPAMADGSDPISTVLSAVSISTVATTIAALALVLVAIKLTFKGPDVAARIIRKV